MQYSCHQDNNQECKRPFHNRNVLLSMRNVYRGSRGEGPVGVAVSGASPRAHGGLARQRALRSRGLASAAGSPGGNESPGGSGSHVGGAQSLEPGLRGPGRAGGQLLQLSHLNERLNCYFYFSSSFHYKKIICCSSSVKCARKIGKGKGSHGRGRGKPRW